MSNDASAFLMPDSGKGWKGGGAAVAFSRESSDVFPGCRRG